MDNLPPLPNGAKIKGNGDLPALPDGAVMRDNARLGSAFIKGTTKTAEDDGGIEFPDMPELGDTDLGIASDAGLTNLFPDPRVELTTDPMEKAKIYSDGWWNFGDPELSVDKYDNPILTWTDENGNSTSAYVNKPGFSGRDVGDIVSQAGQFLIPATKLPKLFKGANALTRMMVAGGGDAAVSAGQQAILTGTGIKEEMDLGKVGEDGLIGATTEALLPPMIKAGKKAFNVARESLPGSEVAKSTALEGGETVVESMADDPIDQIPLTRGQAMPEGQGRIAQLQKEEALRQGHRGEGAQNVMEEFSQRQDAAIDDAAQGIRDQIGAGSPADGSRGIGEQLQKNFIEAEQSVKAQVGKAYDAVDDQAVEVSLRDTDELHKRLNSVVEDMAIDLDEANVLQGVLKRAAKFKSSSVQGVVGGGNKASVVGGLDTVQTKNLRELEFFRRSINSSMGGNTTQTEKAALSRMKSVLDDWVDEAVEKGLFSGDLEAIKQLKFARELRAEYGRLFQRIGNDKTGRLAVQILNENNATPEQVVNMLLGTGTLTSRAEQVGMVKRFKSVFGEDSDQIKLMKDAFLLKAFNPRHTETNAAAIRRNAFNLFKDSKEGSSLFQELFSKQERQHIHRFAMTVNKTIPPKTALNNSNSANFMIRFLRESGLLTSSVLRFAPLVGDGLDRAAGHYRMKQGEYAAREAISPEKVIERLKNIPLLDASTMGAYQSSQEQE
ncbi:hypothetical protein [Curvivirga aplysinae]|uniref:hypothetical protein n=1 Tax=Curvivirga aplysinae TaxID=2529852 RepID=UPI0012BC743D|nr:hypothetical protein [Curvivirga aplysinae]MTI10185.1 hypothetical protein [Curvivirga aplysinae]